MILPRSCLPVAEIGDLENLVQALRMDFRMSAGSDSISPQHIGRPSWRCAPRLTGPSVLGRMYWL